MWENTAASKFKICHYVTQNDATSYVRSAADRIFTPMFNHFCRIGWIFVAISLRSNSKHLSSYNYSRSDMRRRVSRFALAHQLVGFLAVIFKGKGKGSPITSRRS